MNTTPAEIIKAALPSFRAVSPTPEHADFKFTLKPTGELADFNDIETIEVNVRVLLETEEITELTATKKKAAKRKK